jgi:hypothetical protein
MTVNLHFAFEAPTINVVARRDESAHLAVTVNTPARLRIRVPGWANRDRLRLSQMGRMLPLRWGEAYLSIDAAEMRAGQAVELEYELPKSERVEEMPVSHRTYRLTWRGDEVIGCTPPVPIYPPAT